ncbi:hypothetical protein ACIBO5_50965 [Nonomuraea angiospora]|uniref:hypothetical protein n=1 Tax=Nonomuraea angiospora TaxID=46172 RepID=UPI0029BCC53F|nr:hypothetical protein [Nonomuraea angiospora]MDX3107200.1 hypothetical protein [Nonomuraea angiospora]
MHKTLRSRTTAVALCLAAGLALIAAAGVAAARSAQPAAPFWSLMRAGVGESLGEYTFDSLADLKPGAPASGVFTPAAALVEGTIVGVEPGIAFASDDGATTGPIVAHDDPAAAVRYAALVIRVDQVLSGALGLGLQDGKIRLQIEQPLQVGLAELRASLGTAGRGLFYVHNALERRRAEGRTVPQELSGYLASVHIPIGAGVFVEQRTGEPVIAPLMDDPDRVNQILNGVAPPPEPEPEPEPTGPNPPKPTDFPQEEPTDPEWDGSDTPDAEQPDTPGPVEEEPEVDTPTLAELRARALAGS